MQRIYELVPNFKFHHTVVLFETNMYFIAVVFFLGKYQVRKNYYKLMRKRLKMTSDALNILFLTFARIRYLNIQCMY